MKKVLKRTMAVLLTVVMLLTAAPLSGIADFDWSSLFDMSIHASAEDSSEDTTEEDSTMFYETYKAKMLLGLQEIPEGASEFNMAKYLFDHYMYDEVHSPCASFLDSCYSDDSFMIKVNAWKAYSQVGAPSSAVNAVMNHEDYCMTLILQALEITMTENSILNFTKNKAIKNSNNIIKQLGKSLGVSKESQLVDAYAAAWGTDWTTIDQDKINFWYDVVKKSGGGWAKTEKVCGIVGKVLNYTSDIFETADKIAMIGSMSDLEYMSRRWLSEMYEICPTSDVAMKSALLKLYESSSSLEGEWFTSVLECEETLMKWSAKALIDSGIATLCASHPIVASIFIGFAAGKSLCNLFFGSDDVCEQFTILEWLFKLQDLSKQAVESIKSDFTKDQSLGNAYLLSEYVTRYFNLIIDVDIDCMIEFLDHIYNGGILKGIIKWVCGATNDYDVAVEALENLRTTRWDAYQSMNNYIYDCYQLAYPIDCSALFGDSSEHVRIPIGSIYAYLSIKPMYYPSDIDLQVGDFRNIAVELSPENTTQKDVEITSDNESVASVNNFAISGVSEGTANITIRSLYNSNIKFVIPIKVGPKTELEDEDIDYNSYTEVKYFSYSIYNKSVTITGLNNSNISNIKIPRTIEGCPVARIGSKAFKSCANIKRITLPDSVTSIGDDAFYGCSGLTSIKLPDSVTSIGDYAFYGCSSLTSIKLPDSITSVGDAAFYGCSGLTSITIPDNVTSIGCYAFYGCSNLTSITIGNGVTSIDNEAFYGCSSLTSVNYTGTREDWCRINFHGYSNHSESSNPVCYSKCLYINREPVGDVTVPDDLSEINSYSFYNCQNLTSITIPDSVTNIGWSAFYGCTKLTSVTIGRGLTNINGYAFKGCTGLTSITIPNSVTSIGWGAFKGCSSLTSVTIPDSVTSIGNSSFEGCSNLTSVTIPDSVTSIGWSAFEGCSSLTSVTIPDSVTSIGNSAFEGCSSLTSITIPYNVTSIGWGAFYGCSGLTSITIPDSVTSIGDAAFYGCTELTSITIGSDVTSIGEDTFGRCTSLTSITIPDSVISIGDYAFDGCTGLKELTIPCSAKIYSSHYTFNKCTNIEKIILTKGTGTMQSYRPIGSSSNTTYYQYTPWYISKDCIKEIKIEDGVQNIGDYAFYGCSGLTSITIPSSVTSIGDYAFYGGSGLTSITIPDNVTSIGDYALYGCRNLTSITIPDNVTSIGDYAFYGCSGITSITIPDSVTSIGDVAFACGNLKYVDTGDGVESLNGFCFGNSIEQVIIGNSITSIGWGVFKGCSSLTSITIGNGVTSIDNDAFHGCGGLTSVNYTGTREDWCKIKFSNSSSNPVCHSKCLYINGEPIGDVTVPDELSEINSYSFYNCQNLTSITIPDSVTSIGNCAFGGCSSLTSVSIPNSVTNIGSYAFVGCTELTSVTIGRGVTNINNYAFSGCTGLTSVNYAGTREDWCKIKFSNFSSNPVCYSKCLYINGKPVGDVTVPDDLSEINSYSFYNCQNLTNITISDSVTSIGYSAFSGCTGLTGVNYTGTREDWCKIKFSDSGSNPVFYSKCLYINGEPVGDVTVPDDLSEINAYSFYNCQNLTSIAISDTVTSIGYSAFSGCTGLTSVNYTGTREEWCKIKFSNSGSNPVCYSKCLYINGDPVGAVTVPDDLSEINAYSFCDCQNLTSIIIPNSVTSIGRYAFSACTGLTSVTIGNSVTSIGDYAFKFCHSLKTIIYSGTNEDWNSIEKGSLEKDLPNAYVHFGVSAEDASNHLKTEIIKEATCLDFGEKTITCDCGYSYTVSTPVLGHNFEDDKCTRCGSIINVIKLGERKTVTLKESEITYFRFVPETSGTYYFYSDSSYDTYGYIYDSNFKAISSNDDGGNRTNFCVSYSMTAGTVYYFGAKFDSSANTGSFTVAITDDYSADTAHDFEQTVHELSCIYNEETIYKCKNCGYSYTVVKNESTGHNYVDGVCTKCGWLEDLEYSVSDEEVTITGCSGDKTELVIPSNLCGYPVVKIGNYAFEYNNYLTNIAIPDTVITIGDYSFEGCYNLRSIFYSGTLEEWNSIEKGSLETYLPNAYVHFGVSAEDVQTHLNSEITKEATCFDSGEKIITCDCGYSYTVSISALGHQGELVKTFEPKCTLDGYSVYHCNRCGEEYNDDYIDALGHNFENDECTRCGSIINEIKLGDSKTATLNESEIAYYKFTPETSGTYYFYSDSYYDTYGYIYDSNFKVISSNDDGGNGSNFCASYSMTAGTVYYLGARFYSSSNNGSFAVAITDDYSAETAHEIVQTVYHACCISGETIVYKCKNCNYKTIITDGEATGHNYVDGVCTECGWLEDLEYSVSDEEVTITGYSGDKTELVIPSNLCGYPVVKIGNCAFEYNDYLTNITIPDSVTIIGDYAFYGCSILTSITIPDSVTIIWDYAFCGCSSLTSITIPESVTIIGEYSFCGCSSLTSITVGESNEYYSSDEYGVLYNKDKTEIIQYPIGNSRKSFTIPDSVTSIGSSAFGGCGSLTNITMPNSVTSIGVGVFEYCWNLRSIFYSGTSEEWNSIEKGSLETDLPEVFVHFGVSAEDVHTHLNSEITKEATCYDYGEMTITCECGYSYVVYIPELDHQKGDLVQKVDPTCINSGYSVYQCNRCDEEFYTDYVDSLGHNQGELVRTVDPTCTDWGYSVYRCDRCNEEYNDNYTDSLGHQSNLVKTVEPTCTDYGYSVYHCERCDEEYKGDYIEPIYHSFENDVCTRCGYAISDIMLGETKTVALKESERAYFKFTPETSGTLYFYSYGNRDTYGNLYDSDMNHLISDDDNGYNGNFKLSYEFEAGHTYYLVARFYSSSSSGDISVSISQSFSDFTKVPDSTTVIDSENKLIYGLASGLNRYNDIYNFIAVSDDYYIDFSSDSIGTGTVLSLYNNADDLTDEYTIIVFGDVNGDGWYDGQDAVTVSMIAGGMLTREQVGEAVWMAADCNHDGVIDQADVELLNQAGVLLSSVDQTKSTDELIETSAEYVEYLNLIDQQTDADSDEAPEDNTEATEDNEEPTELSLWNIIVKYFVELIKKFLSVIKVF